MLDGFRAPEDKVPSLPPILYLPDLQEIYTAPDPWVVQDLSMHSPIRFKFGDLSVLRNDMITRLQHTVAHFLETRSAAHAMNLFFRFRAFYKEVLSQVSNPPLGQIELVHILSWQAKLSAQTIWQLGTVRVLLEKANSLGFNISSPEALAWLNAAVIPGNPKGVDVRTRDPNRGPFSAAEVETLNASLNDAYANGEINLSDFAAGHVLLAFGMRGRQLAALKEKDLIVVPAKDEEKRYLLRIPQAKQRGEIIRDSFRTRLCDRRLGRLLQHLLDENCARKIDLDVPSDEWPMFIAPDAGSNPPGFAYHQSAARLTSRIRTIIESRTQIKANSKRFRHTLAQNMADDGASVYEIAEALGHTDTQQVGKYVEARPEMVARLNHLAEDLAPIMQAFAGVLLASQDPEARMAPLDKRLHDRALENGGERPLGHCGQHSFCDLAKPIGCYTCRSFNAWDDGPHEDILAKLLVERQRKIDRGLSSKIYTINDRTIGAVTKVVQLCRMRHAGFTGVQEVCP